MSDVTSEHHTSLTKLPTYLGNGTMPDAGWKQSGSGHMLVNTSNGEPTALIIVGRVLDSLLNVGPLGNFSTKYPLENARFQFTLCQPDGAPFAADWERAWKGVQVLQNKVSDTKYQRNFLTFNGKMANLRFSSPVFECLEEADAAARADAVREMNEWPVEDAAQVEFEILKKTHAVCPLPVYMGNTFVEPDDVKSAMNNALVEVHFSLKHYRIGKDDDRFDSFTGKIEQIEILKRGFVSPSGAYKRKNPRDGPIIPSPQATRTKTQESRNSKMRTPSARIKEKRTTKGMGDESQKENENEKSNEGVTENGEAV